MEIFSDVSPLKGLTYGEIQKFVVPCSTRWRSIEFTQKPFDIKIVITKQSTKKYDGVNVNFGNPIFCNYGYITFYVIDDILFFKLSNEYDVGKSYTISGNTKRPDTTRCTKVAGIGFDKLKEFEGTYYMQKFDEFISETEEMFFIRKHSNIRNES